MPYNIGPWLAETDHIRRKGKILEISKTFL
jgi:hypothetical protein